MGKKYDDLYYGEVFLRKTIRKGNAHIRRFLCRQASTDLNFYFADICREFLGGEYVDKIYMLLEPAALYEYNKYIGNIVNGLSQGRDIYSCLARAASGVDRSKIACYISYEKDKVLSLENLEDGKAALIRYLSDKYGTKIGPNFNFEDEVRAEVIAHDNEIAAKKAARERVKENKMKAPTSQTRENAEEKFSNKVYVEAEKDEEDEYDNDPQMFTEEGYPLREKQTRRGIEYYTEFDKRPYHGMIYDEERNICEKV
ncbi:MAG: hypothetical protein J5689_02515 [Clostridia bacterium]|nr:hypothetical protein [Clostridia bacterium]